MNIWYFAIALMAAFWSGAFVAMMSGALFAYIVFRTKREAHERLFGLTQGGSYAGTDPADDGGAYTSDPAFDVARPVGPPTAPDPFQKSNDLVQELLARQMAAEKAGTTGENPSAKYDDGPEPEDVET